MGCVSSKLLMRKEVEREIRCGVPNHVVSLTSTTYGALQLDNPPNPKQEEAEDEEQAEVINAWELMGDLEEETMPVSVRGKKSPKTVAGLGRSPFKRLNKADTPKKKLLTITMGKENRGNTNVTLTPQRERERERERGSKSCDFRMMPCSSVTSSSMRRKSLSPLFDPELLQAYEKELFQEQQQQQEEQIKKIISESGSRVNSSGRFDCRLDDFDNKCPPGGEDRVVVYTTTLRGIRKTFEGCNTVRSILESHQIRMYERDVSMDSGFKEELRKLLINEFRIPVVFVKGRLIGGAPEISKLEEEGRLGSLLDQIPRNSSSVCQGCGGLRFIMCVDCSGSCKVLDEEHKNTVRCGECNENGLIHCPLCC